MNWKHIVVAASILVGGLASAASGETGLKTVTIGTYVEIPSEVLGRKQTILVSLPGGHALGSRSYPVVYLLNGHNVARFANLVSVVEIESDAGKFPEMIVVGIDTQRDYARNTFPTQIEGWPGSGGADRFIKFMTTELFPFVKDRYRAADFNVLVGPSNAGLQAIYAMLSDSHNFRNVIAVSPSIGWCTDFMVEKLRSWAPPGSKPEANLYIVSGTDDYGDIVLPGVDAFVAELERCEGKRLRWAAEQVQDDGHVPLRGFELGLAFIFDGYRFPADSYEQVGLEGIISHYSKLTKRYGFEVRIPRELLEELGNAHMQRKEWNKATAVYDLWTKTETADALPYYLMAVSYKAMGDTEHAQEHCRRSLALDPEFRPASSLYESLSTKNMEN